MTKANFITVIALVLMVLGSIFVLLNEGTPDAQAAEYRNVAYGFSFSYPENLRVNEYSSQTLSVGTPTEDGFLSSAEVSIILGTETERFETFSAFAASKAKVFCSAEGPNSTSYCTEIKKRESFTTNAGASGERMNLVRKERMLDSAEETESLFGPVLVFNISGMVREAEFAGLFIYPPSGREISAELLQDIAASIELGKSTEISR